MFSMWQTNKQTKDNLTLLSFRIRLPWLSVEFCIRIIPVGLPVGEVFTIWKQNSTNVQTNILQRTTPKDTDTAMCAVLDDPWLSKNATARKFILGLIYVPREKREVWCVKKSNLGISLPRWRSRWNHQCSECICVLIIEFMFEELIFIQFANVKDRVLKTDVLAKWLPYAEKVKNSEFDFSKSCATFVKNLFKGSRKKISVKKYFKSIGTNQSAVFIVNSD